MTGLLSKTFSDVLEGIPRHSPASYLTIMSTIELKRTGQKVSLHGALPGVPFLKRDTDASCWVSRVDIYSGLEP